MRFFQNTVAAVWQPPLTSGFTGNEWRRPPDRRYAVGVLKTALMRNASLYLAALTALSTVASALAQPTAFSYQGELRSTGIKANGLHDFRFRLYDAISAGSQIGSVQCIDNVNVSDGRFSTPIDFGQLFDSTAPRFLEIEVRQDTGQGCATTTGYTLLLPRYPITATPRATAAGVANSLSAPDGSPANAVFVDNDGKIGIGTEAPTHSMHVANPAPTLALQDTDSNTEQVGYISFRDTTNVERERIGDGFPGDPVDTSVVTERAWVGYGSPGDPDISIINARTGGDIVLSPLGGGNVGIGTPSPQAKLDVRGDIRFGSGAQYFPTAADQPFAIVYGTVDDLNSGHCTSPPIPIRAGSGFSVQPSPDVTLAAAYLITFDRPFLSPPSVVASSFWDSFFGGKHVTIISITTTGFHAQVFASLEGRNICRQFSFIAIGVR